MKSIKQAKINKGTKVLLRADFNVPMKGTRIIDTFRIDKTIPTIQYLLKKKAVVIIVAHIGDDGKNTLRSVAKYLGDSIPVVFTQASELEHVKHIAESLLPGTVLILENIRRFPGEKENNLSFAKQLASLADVYVNDAFSVCHRMHASIVSVPKYLPSYAGFQLEKEIKELSKVFNPKHPFLFILGGAKFDTKLPLIKRFISMADNIFIGGALANQVFLEHGFSVGVSVVEDKNFGLVKLVKHNNILLPHDLVVISGTKKRTSLPTDIQQDESMVDIGKDTLTFLSEKIQKAKCILWNGPVGKLPHGTKVLLESIAHSKAISIIGGGDTVEIVSKYGMEKDFTFVSTGGGATIDFLAHKTLPGIKALK